MFSKFYIIKVCVLEDVLGTEHLIASLYFCNCESANYEASQESKSESKELLGGTDENIVSLTRPWGH